MTDFEVRRIPGGAIVAMPMRLDVTNAQALIEVVRPLLAEPRGVVALDFRGTDAIDSTALGAIVHLRKGHEARLVLLRVGETVLRVLAITRLDVVFPRYADEDELAAALGGAE